MHLKHSFAHIVRFKRNFMSMSLGVQFLLVAAALFMCLVVAPSRVEAGSTGNFMYNCGNTGQCSNFTIYNGNTECSLFGVKPYETYMSQMFCSVGGGFQVLVYSQEFGCGQGYPVLALVGIDRQLTSDSTGTFDGYFTVNCISF